MAVASHDFADVDIMDIARLSSLGWSYATWIKASIISSSGPLSTIPGTFPAARRRQSRRRRGRWWSSTASPAPLIFKLRLTEDERRTLAFWMLSLSFITSRPFIRNKLSPLSSMQAGPPSLKRLALSMLISIPLITLIDESLHLLLIQSFLSQRRELHRVGRGARILHAGSTSDEASGKLYLRGAPLPIEAAAEVKHEDCQVCYGVGIDLPDDEKDGRDPAEDWEDDLSEDEGTKSPFLDPSAPSEEELSNLGPIECFCIARADHVAHRACAARWLLSNTSGTRQGQALETRLRLLLGEVDALRLQETPGDVIEREMIEGPSNDVDTLTEASPARSDELVYGLVHSSTPSCPTCRQPMQLWIVQNSKGPLQSSTSSINSLFDFLIRFIGDWGRIMRWKWIFYRSLLTIVNIFGLWALAKLKIDPRVRIALFSSVRLR